MKLHRLTFTTALAAIFAVTPASAATITGLYNTGTDASGAALVGGNGVIDPNYSIVASSDPTLVGNQAVTYNFPYPIPEDGNSRWISTASDGNAPASATYRLSFDLSGFDAATANVSGSFAADNNASLFLNGVSTGFSVAGFSAFTNFALTSGFVSGINTLDFVVLNAGGPGAFRVDNLQGTANVLVTPPGAIPEPGTWALLILGFGLVGGALRQRKARCAFA
jgi:hypothetical protein